jgi:hypothetical protein
MGPHAIHIHIAMTAIPCSLEFCIKSSIGGSGKKVKSEFGLISDLCRHGTATIAMGLLTVEPVSEGSS